MTYLVPHRDGHPVRGVPNRGDRLRVYTQQHLDEIPQLQGLASEDRFTIKVVASVLPFRVNQHVLTELIDWDRVPDDPIFQLVFPQRGMLEQAHFERMADLHLRAAGPAEIRAAADAIRRELNPHPAGQQEHNVPIFRGRALEGVQHKYRETVLFFPSQGQTCHAYCSFCFRWAQFVGQKELRFAETDASRLHDYLAAHPEVSDLLVTGGDPLIMKTKVLARYLEPLLDPRFDHLQSIRLGSKALTFWPQRFVTDDDAGELLRLFRKLADAGKHVAFMAHLDHWRELEPEMTRRAVRRLQDAGAVIRAQAPLLRHVNDDAATWATLWRNEVRLGIVPYYMFVERDTGAKAYFEVPLARAHDVYRDAMGRVSGLARTARGPSMSAGPGKVEIQGVTRIAGEKVFSLRFIQARKTSWVQRPFFARYDEHATWLDQLKPAFGEQSFFFDQPYARLCREREAAHAAVLQ
jgi:KamA family protein